MKHHCISFDSEMEGYEAPKQCIQKSYTLSAAMSRRAEPLISRLSIPLSWCVMSTLHKVRKKKKVFARFSRESPSVLFLKLPSHFFWNFPASSGEACLSSPLFHFGFHDDTFLAPLSADPAFMQSWKDHGKHGFFSLWKSKGLGDNVISFPEMWKDDWRKWNTAQTSFFTGDQGHELCSTLTFSSFWTRLKMNHDAKEGRVLFLSSGI